MRMIAVLGILLLACMISSARAEQASIDSPVANDRALAFNAIRSELAGFGEGSAAGQRRQELRGSLIRLLGHEADLVRSGHQLSEDYSEYYADLINTVASFKDMLALGALLRPEVLQTGNSAAQGVGVLGDGAVASVLSDYAKSQDDLQRVALLRVMLAMEASGTLKVPQNHAALEAVMLRAAGEENPFIRLNAIKGLAYYKDQRSHKAIEHAAKSDPYIVQNDASFSYPVRNEALNILSKMEE